MTDRALRLRRNAGFRRFWAASTISDFGTQVGAVAIGVLVVADLGGTATDVGLVQSAGVAPYLAVGLFAGVLADRMRRKPLLVGTDLGRALVLACVPLLAVTGILDVPVLAALMVAFGLLSVLNAAAHQSFLPRLLPRELLPRANARLEQSVGLGAEGPIELAYRQAVTPDRLQGRMNATMRSFNRAAVVVGAPLGGLFADAVGLRPALWLGAAGIGAAGVLLAASGFRTASHDDEAP